MLKLCSVFAALICLSLFAKSPPVGTGYTISYSGAGGVLGHITYEEDATSCLLQVASFSQSLLLKAAVQVYPANRPGLTRVFALGNTLNKVSELWLVDASVARTQKFSYTDVVSVAPYSNQEVLVAQKDGQIFVVDGDGMELHKYLLTDHFPPGFRAIGDVVHAWRSGVDSISVLTQNFFVHFDGNRTVIIQMNPTVPTAPNAYIPSFDLGTIFTGIGDDQYVWIVHDWTVPTHTPSFSLFHLATGKFLQRHVAPGPVRGLGPVSPIYFESATETGYFAMNDNFIGVSLKTVVGEKPAGQLSASGLGITLPGAAVGVTFAPPAQGTPWGAQSPGWMTPQWGQRGTGSTARLASKPTNYAPGVGPSKLSPAASATPTPTPQSPPPDPNEKKIAFGVVRTRAQFTDYLKQEFGFAVDASGQVSSADLVQHFSNLGGPLRIALNGLSDSFLKPHGVQYHSNGLLMDGPNKKTPLSEWVEELWKGFKFPVP